MATAVNGPETLEKASQLTPDLILLDVMMPGMSGYDVCRQLRANPLTAPVPIMMITALTDRESRLEGVEAGADDFISKPLDPDELKARVQTIIRLNRYHLLRERAKFEQLVKLSPESIMIVRFDGDDDGDDDQYRIDLVNPAMLATLGVEREEQIVGQDLLTFVTPDQAAACSTFLRDIIADEEKPPNTSIETRFVRPNGHIFPAEIKAARFTWNREPAAQVIIHDITERQRAEEALRRHANEQSALYAVASAATTLLDPDEMLTTVLDTVLDTLEADAGWVILPNASSPDAPPQIVVQRQRGCTDQRLALDEVMSPPHACSIRDTWKPNGNIEAEPQPQPIDRSQCPLAQGMENVIGIPLSAGDTILGVMGVAWRTQHSPTESDQALMLAIGQQVGLALRNIQLYQAARQMDRLRVLNELDQALSATLNPEKVAETTLHQIATALDAQMGAFFMTTSLPDQYPQQVYTLGQGRLEIDRVGENAQILKALIQRVESEHQVIRLSSSELGSFIQHQEVVNRWGPNGLAIPLWGEEGLVAILTLGERPANRPLTDEDRALARSAASRAVQAIKNAQLYRASQEQSARLSTLNTISAAAVSSLELDTMLRQVLALTTQALNAASGSILVREPDTGELVFVLTLNQEIASQHSIRLSPGQGIAGWAVQHDQSVRVNDVQQDPRWHDGIDAVTGFETHSLICTPLRHSGEITGLIEVVNKQDGTFTDEDLHLLEAVSSIAAAALENARLYMATKSHAAELAMLNEVGLAVTSTLDFSTVVHAALSQIQRRFQAEIVSLLQLNPQTNELHFVQVLVRRQPVEIPVRLQPGEGIAQWALEHRQPVLIEDIQKDPRFTDWVYKHIGIQARAMMVIPLIAREHVVGIIEVTSTDPGIYRKDELRTLQAIGSTLAIALENASLYDELKTLVREREEAQSQLIHAEKMSALGRLVASITHEINNPLQATQTYLTLAQEELEMNPTPQLEKLTRYLGTVGDEIERISSIVNRMRDFYRPARRELELTYLHAVLESVLELTSKQLQHSAIVVERDWAEALPEIAANPDHLKQVFLNLVLNAIDAMPEGGTLHIHTAPDRMDRENHPQSVPAVRVEFSDTGDGMPPHVLAHLFEPFYTTKERGTGLGLSISYGIIKAHNGQIAVESHIGLGTTFTILLPTEQPLNS